MRNMKQRLSGKRGLAVLLAVLTISLLPLSAQAALEIEIISAYNLVVDSNVTTPATYAPSAATVGAKICNTGSSDITNVQAYIGDYTGAGSGTPGTYPAFNSTEDSRAWLKNTGTYSLKQESGSYSSAEDASRAWVGTIPAGECKVEYWVVSYPQCVNVSDGAGGYVSQSPPCATSITGGSTTADDLTLSYDVWATGIEGGSSVVADATQDLTLRSELSAAANKIWPNGDNKVPDEYKAAIEESLGWDVWTPSGSYGGHAYPGEIVRTQGIWYDLGNVNQGFDNDGDGVPDQNAWLQPIGDASVYDPGCFRLVRTYGLLVVKLKDGGEQLIPFEDQMYFENIPDNTGVTGLVFYEYAALNGACTGALTPYQEVASGNLNEKFSGDYGAGYQMQTQEPKATATKTVAPTTAAPGSELTYSLEVSNPATSAYGGLTVTVGSPDIGAPLVIRDAIPAGTTYVPGSATVIEGTDKIAAADVAILYSGDHGETWSTTPPTTVTDLQWMANVGLENAKQMKVEFKVTVPGTYTEPVVSNTGCAAIGSGPCFAEADTVTVMQGDRTISGTVFLDDGTGGGVAGDGAKQSGEATEGSVTVTLYYDANGDGKLDDGDIKWGETETDGTGTYSFPNLPAEKFIAVVDDKDADLTAGAAPTTDTEIAADVTGGNVTGVDFGFMPPLDVSKTVVSTTEPYGDGENITYQLTVKNQLPATGSNVGGKCVYTLFPSNNIDASAAWTNADTNVYAVDGNYAVVDVGSNSDSAGWNGFAAPVNSGSIADVKVVIYDGQPTGSYSWTDNEAIDVIISKSPTSFAEPVQSVEVPLTTIISGSTYEYIDLFADRTSETWQWTEIKDLTVTLTAHKGSNPSGDFKLDAVALQVTSSEPCPTSSSNIITDVKLQDEYNNTELTYVSSSPAKDSDNVSGTTTTQIWNNLGPLAPGESKVVTVTMKGNNDGTSGTVTALNTARVADGDAIMGDGRVVNPDSATESVDIVPAIDISGTLFSDKNADGWYSSTGDNPSVDTYLPGQTVELWACATDAEPHQVLVSGTETNDCDSNSGYNWYPIATTITDDSGNYIFEGVTQGYYFVKAPDAAYSALPSASPADNENNPTTGDSTPDAYWGSPVNTTTNSGGGSNTLNGRDLNTFFRVGGTSGNWTDATNVNFGYGITTGAVSGYVWEDVDGDGVQDAGENGLAGITVELIDCGADNDCSTTVDNGVTTVTTNDDGLYEFPNLDNGQNYRINVLESTGALTSGTWDQTQEAEDGEAANPGNADPIDIDGYIEFTASGGQILFDRDLGYHAVAETGNVRQIDGTIYYDLNGDGAQGTSEPGVEGLTVYLYQDEDGDGVVDPGTDALYTSVTTKSDGSYSFVDLPAGNFLVVVDDSPIGTYQQIEDPDVAPGGGVCVGTQCDSDGKADVTSGDVNNLDLGYQPPQDDGNAMSGQVWRDLNGDGINDGGMEKGIAGVTVTLQWSPDGGTTWVDLDTTTASDGTTDVDDDGYPDPAGSYYFGDLPNGMYRVAVSEADTNLPKNVGDNPYTPTNGTSADSKVYSDPQTVLGGTTSENNDLGFGPSGVIGDSIYWDVDGDGTQDAGEPGIGGVTIELYTFTDTDGDGRWDVGEPISETLYTSTTTGTDGSYLFPGLPDGNYVVKVGAIPGDPQITADPDADGDVCPAAGDICDNQHGVAINGNTYMGADFGYQPPLFIGDQLFIDSNRSGGAMDENDQPLAHVTVTLRDCGDNGTCGDGDDTVYTTETDENGNYAFVEGLVNAHNYQVSVDTGDSDWPVGLGLTPSYNGADGLDTDGSTDNSITLTLGTEPVTDADIGYQFPDVNDLSGTICLDGAGADGDGVCGSSDSGVDTGETAYVGTTVYVSKWIDSPTSGTVGVIDPGELVLLTQTQTDENGDYTFNGLPSISEVNDHYVVSLTAPEAFLNLTTEAADTATDSLIEKTSGDYTASVMQIINDDGDKTGLDLAFAKSVVLDFGDLPLPFETTLGVDGARHVVKATPDLYLGAGVTTETDGIPSVGATSDTDDGIVKVGTWSEGTGGGKISVTTYGKGWFIGWIDFNGDGSFSGDGEMIVSKELGTAGTSVPNQELTFNIPTGGLNSPGYARFRFFPSAPPFPTAAFKGIASNGEVEDYWFDLGASSSIGDQILYDSDGNGVPDQGLEGVVVELQNDYCNAGVDCPTATTDANGNYIFTGVGLGDYTVVVKSGLPDGATQIYDPDGTRDDQTVVSITENGTTYLDADFWYGSAAPPTTGTIGDRIWNDADGDGVQDLGESGIEGIIVELQDGTCTPLPDTSANCLTTTTAADGSYSFAELNPGSYTVKIIDPPSGADQTGDPDVPGTACSGSSCDGATTVTITAAGQTILTADFGYKYPATDTTNIGNRIWFDADKDGIQDGGSEEPGLGGVTVVLKNADGDVVAQTVTDGNGYYTFPGVPAGTYTVEVTDANGVLDSMAPASEKDGSLDGSHTVTVSDSSGSLVCNTGSTATTSTYSCDNQINFGYAAPVPTYALISSFKAYINDDNQTVLEWKTDSEVGTIGFLLERLNEQTGAFETVSELLPGMLLPPQGGSYRFVDPSAEPKKEHSYRVREVTVNGDGIVSGPYTVTPKQPLLINRQMFADGPAGFTLAQADFSAKQINRFAAHKQAARSLAAEKKRKTGDTVKVPVSKDGMVYLTADELAAASGLRKAEVTRHLKNGKLSLTLAGEPVSVLSSAVGSALWFYGYAPERNDIGQNIYLLELGKTKGAEIKNSHKRAEKKADNLQSFTAQVKTEENHLPLYMNTTKPVRDFWGWDYLMAPSKTEISVSYVSAPNLTGEGTARISVNFVAVKNYNSGTAAPYKVSVSLNGSNIGAAEWRENGDYQFQAELPADQLREEGNEVKLVAQLNNGVTHSVIFLDSIEVEYQRQAQVVNGELTFSSSADGSMTVDGFSSRTVLALDITDPNEPVRIYPTVEEEGEGAFTVTVPTQAEHRYFLTENITATVSGELTADTPSNLRDPRNRADYLLISPLNLLDAAQRLAEYRETQGLETLVVDIDDVQDEFSHSLAEPKAVRDFLAYVHENWAKVPHYVVMIGDGSYDYKNYLGAGMPMMPTALSLTPGGYLPSDNVLADVAGDDKVPEFAIGRIPAFDNNELSAYVDKLIAYEQAAGQGGSLSIVVDASDPAAGNFQASADKVTALAPNGFAVEQIAVDTLGQSGARSKTTAVLRQGGGILHYIGHSSLVAYGRNGNLLTAAQLADMNNLSKPMLMVSMSCSSASFGYPLISSIGQSAVLKEGGAAVGFFGSTGLSYNYLADIMADGFYSSLSDPAVVRVGDAVLRAKQQYAEQEAMSYTLDIYNLLGDPAALIPVPAEH